MKRNIDAVIFDADGTILDTRELIFQAMQHVLHEHGYDMPERSALVAFGGRPTEETYAHFAPHHDSAQLSLKQRIFQMEHLDLFAAYEGLEELLAQLKQMGCKIGICTSRRKNIIDFLEHLDIKHHFDAIMHADLVTNYKPHPEGLLKLLQQMQVEPSRAVMVGDTDADIGAGKAAGVAFTIGITHGIGTREMLEESGADHIVDHLNDILPLLAH
jgi:HAD superfamily hydrolase (TIGR01509 family)